MGWCRLKSKESLVPDPQIVEINVGDLFAYRNITPELQTKGDDYRNWVLKRLKKVLNSFPNLEAILISTDKFGLMYKGGHTEPLPAREFNDLYPKFIPDRFETRYFIQRPFKKLKSFKEFEDKGAQRNYVLFLP